MPNAHLEQFDAIIATPVPGRWRLGIACTVEGVRTIDWLPANTVLCPAQGDLARTVAEAVEGYFSTALIETTLPLIRRGTPFQRRVWSALVTIEPGSVMTYGELAHRVGSGARAVANACRNNPWSVLVPCHRVVSAGGYGGYSGSLDGPALEVKKWLLRHEQGGGSPR